MRQIISNLKTGEIYLAVTPEPSIEDGHVLIETKRTLISQGTEKMLVQFGKASLFQKARSQPAKVKQVLEKIKTEGLIPTVEAVFRKLDEPLPMGYCNAGIVIGLGDGVLGFRLGDRVASNGPHAEVVSVQQNLVAKIPDNVSDDAASFTVVGSIALHGIRLAKPEFGEIFVVLGLGLIGQITGQLLRANGCRVIGFDFDVTKIKLAKEFGIDAILLAGDTDPVKEVMRQTSGVGCDGVIITASTQSNNVIAQAAQMSRKRGRIILVGVIGLDINRADFYEKELTFQVSCSYGPGRYDTNYEDKSLDYPLPFVRWTENRNFQAVLNALGSGSLIVEPLVTQRVDLSDFRKIYDNINTSSLASLLIYGGQSHLSTNPQFPRDTKVEVTHHALTPKIVKIGECRLKESDRPIAIVGAGNFTKMTVLPTLSAAKVPIKLIVSATGVTGTALAKKYSIPYSSTEFSAALLDKDIKGVVITTRHNLHAKQTIAALKAGKRLMIEKPLCLNVAELRDIQAVVKEAKEDSWVTVGFNRRFSPHAEQMRKLLSSSSAPISVIATINAGTVPQDHWVHDPEIGGGRLIGEACHFIDFAIFLTGSLVVAVFASEVGGASDCASILLRHSNGSVSVVNYLANGSRLLSKERVEVHCDGRSLLLDNFRVLSGFGWGAFSSLKTKQDKGHKRQFAMFSERLKIGGPPLIPWEEIANSTSATLAVPVSIRERRWISVSEIQ